MKHTDKQRIDFSVCVGCLPEKRPGGWWYLPMDWLGKFTGPHKTMAEAIDAAMGAGRKEGR